MSTAPAEDGNANFQQDTYLQDPAYTKYLPYLLSGELADITIFAPLPPGTEAPEQPAPSPPTSASTDHPVSQYTPVDPKAQVDAQQSPIPSSSLFLAANKAPDLTTTTTTTTSTHQSKTASSLFMKPATTTSTTTTSSTTSSTSKSPPAERKYMTFNLHRFIIASRSPVLAILLQQSPVLTISLRSDVFQALVWTMYTDSNDRIPIHLYPHVLWAAEYYAIKPAQIWALQTTIRIATKENMVDLANHLLLSYDPIQSAAGQQNSATFPAKSSSTTTSLDAISPILSLENCPKSFTYLCDFILNIFYGAKDAIYDLKLFQLNPAMVKLLTQADPTLPQHLFE